jgi:hypothetical protein
MTICIKIINEEIDFPRKAIRIAQLGKPDIILKGGEGIFIDLETETKLIKVEKVDLII